MSLKKQASLLMWLVILIICLVVIKVTCSVVFTAIGFLQTLAMGAMFFAGGYFVAKLYLFK